MIQADLAAIHRARIIVARRKIILVIFKVKHRFYFFSIPDETKKGRRID